jgi:hypothetical protein
MADFRFLGLKFHWKYICPSIALEAKFNSHNQQETHSDALTLQTFEEI